MQHIARLQRMNHGSQFRAFSLRGDMYAKPIDPFLGVDHAWISGPTFPPHPHAGFSAVSYLFLDSETGIDNEDSLGNRNLIQPGGLHWTAAGDGVVHEEVPAVTGKTVHMLQMFINLPANKQAEAPFVFSVETQDVPVVHLAGAKIRVPPQGPDRVIRLAAPNGNAKAVVFSGIPLNQPVHWRGPMALASANALTRAVTRYEQGEFGTLQRT